MPALHGTQSPRAHHRIGLASRSPHSSSGPRGRSLLVAANSSAPLATNSPIGSVSRPLSGRGPIHIHPWPATSGLFGPAQRFSRRGEKINHFRKSLPQKLRRKRSSESSLPSERASPESERERDAPAVLGPFSTRIAASPARGNDGDVRREETRARTTHTAKPAPFAS